VPTSLPWCRIEFVPCSCSAVSCTVVSALIQQDTCTGYSLYEAVLHCCLVRL
jgi:hypothetical protein